MNEKGLVANVLYLAESDYGKPDDRPSLSISLWSTIWRTVADHKNLVYVFDSATSPNTFWVPRADLDLKAGAPVKKLTIAGGEVHAGNAANQFQPAEPFQFLPGEAKP